MVLILEAPALTQMRMIEHASHIFDGRAGDADLLECGVRLLDRPSRHLRLDQGEERIVVLRPDEAVGEERRAGPVRVADEGKEARPVVLGDADQEEEAVGELHHAPWPDNARAQARGHPAAVGVVQHRVLRLAGDCRLDGDIDVLPSPVRVAGGERGEGGERAVQARLEMRLLPERLERRQVGVG